MTFMMDLADVVKEDLKKLDSSKLKSYIESLNKNLLSESEAENLSLEDPTLCSLQILIVESARHGMTKCDFKELLDGLGLDTNISTAIVDFYAEKRANLTSKLLSIKNQLPKVENVSWKLECITQVIRKIL